MDFRTHLNPGGAIGFPSAQPQPQHQQQLPPPIGHPLGSPLARMAALQLSPQQQALNRRRTSMLVHHSHEDNFQSAFHAIPTGGQASPLAFGATAYSSTGGAGLSGRNPLHRKSGIFLSSMSPLMAELPVLPTAAHHHHHQLMQQQQQQQHQNMLIQQQAAGNPAFMAPLTPNRAFAGPRLSEAQPQPSPFSGPTFPFVDPAQQQQQQQQQPMMPSLAMMTMMMSPGLQQQHYSPRISPLQVKRKSVVEGPTQSSPQHVRRRSSLSTDDGDEGSNRPFVLPSSVAMSRTRSRSSSSLAGGDHNLVEQSDCSAANSVSSTPTIEQQVVKRTRSFQRNLASDFSKQEEEEEEEEAKEEEGPTESEEDSSDEEIETDKAKVFPNAKRQISTSSTATSKSSTKSDGQQAQGGLGGERRLNIAFESHGTVDPENKQTFGKYGWCIPDGLCGTHTMYAQRWRFEITHSKCMGTTVLTWKITNLTSGGVVTMTETPQQATQRQMKGNTICNIVLRRALDQRADELDTVIGQGQKNAIQVANLRSLIKELKPRQCTEGLLFFGLRHECVQLRDGRKSPKLDKPEA